jgi:hypothetical protein
MNISLTPPLNRPTAGGSGAWSRPICSKHFSRKIQTVNKRFLSEIWPSHLQPIVGLLFGFFRIEWIGGFFRLV